MTRHHWTGGHLPTFVAHLECSLTGEQYPADTLQTLSKAGRPLLVRYDLDGIRRALPRAALAAPAPMPSPVPKQPPSNDIPTPAVVPPGVVTVILRGPVVKVEAITEWRAARDALDAVLGGVGTEVL